MEDGLVPTKSARGKIWSECLNPYCSGRWSRTGNQLSHRRYSLVLILIVVEDGLVLAVSFPNTVELTTVLILIVVEDGLVQATKHQDRTYKLCLNPYCSGRWSRTDYTEVPNRLKSTQS